MSLTFPLSVEAFADTLGIKQVTWLLKDNRELSGLASGQVLEADLAPQLWQADVTLRDWYHVDARRIEAKLNAVIRSIGSFYLYDPRKPYPAEDPDGSILGSSSVTINAVADGKSLSLAGLPVGYVLTEGDYLAFDYSDPTRRWFGEVAEAATADGNGITPTFEVSPFLPSAAAANIAVTLIKPAMKCIITPGTLSPEQSDHVPTTAITFSVTQKR